MKLYIAAPSPFARKCRIVAREKGLADRIAEMTVDPYANAPELLASNPLVQIPTLIAEDGLPLNDSPVICEYLDSLGAGPRLIPQGDARWATLRLQALADGVLDAAFSSVMETRRPEAQRSEEWLTRWRASIARAVTAAGVEPARTSPELNLGQITLACALGYLDFRHPDIDWRRAAPELTPWFETWAARPSFAATVPG